MLPPILKFIKKIIYYFFNKLIDRLLVVVFDIVVFSFLFNLILILTLIQLLLPQKKTMKQSDINTEHFKVRSYQMDTKARLNLTSIAGYLQEAAGNHATANGFGYHEMLKSGMLWVLTRMKILVHKFPGWGDDLELDTWVVDREKFFSRRDFEIKSKQGEILISAISGWMLIDFKQKRPQIVDAFPMNIKMFPDKLAINENLEKLEGPNFVNSESTIR